LSDLAAGHESEAALLVLVGAPRLTRLGVTVPARPATWLDGDTTPEHRLYALLARTHADSAHSRYNALIRTLVSLRTGPRMRQLTDGARRRQFMRRLGRASRVPGRVYLTGGACAVLLEWRPTTIDIDLEFDAPLEPLLREIPVLEEELRVNVELASPSRFSRSYRAGATAAHSSRARDRSTSITTTSTRRPCRRSNGHMPATSATCEKWRRGD
jgi:hypothetical protein